MATYLGEALTHDCEDDHFVAALFLKNYKGLVCSLHLPFTDWVAKQTKVAKPIRTAKVIGGSTLQGFRSLACEVLREAGYDVRCWLAKGGASEEDVALEVANDRLS